MPHKIIRYLFLYASYLVCLCFLVGVFGLGLLFVYVCNLLVSLSALNLSVDTVKISAQNSTDSNDLTHFLFLECSNKKWSSCWTLCRVLLLFQLPTVGSWTAHWAVRPCLRHKSVKTTQSGESTEISIYLLHSLEKVKITGRSINFTSQSLEQAEVIPGSRWHQARNNWLKLGGRPPATINTTTVMIRN